MYDCDDIRVYERLLQAAGVSKDKFDINNYCGLTARELRALTESAIKKFKGGE